MGKQLELGWDTAESTPLDDFVRPRFRVANFDELGTYQAKTGVKSFSPEWKKGIFPDEDSSDDSGLLLLRFAFIPPINDVGFPAHVVNMPLGFSMTQNFGCAISISISVLLTKAMLRWAALSGTPPFQCR